MPLKIVSVVQNKGGDGKTTLAIIQAIYYAHIKNKKTLLIDFDPQANSSSRFIPMEYDDVYSGDHDSTWKPPIHESYDSSSVECEGWNGRYCSADLFLSDDGVEPYSTSFENLKLIPAWSARLDKVERIERVNVQRLIIRKLQDFMNLPELEEMFDYIVIDTPPVLRPVTLASLASCSDVLIPVQLAQPSLNGVYAILRQIENQKNMRSDEVQSITILPNRVKANTKRTSYILDQLRKNPKTQDKVIESILPERESLAELCEWGDHSKIEDKQFDSPFSDTKSNKLIREIVLNVSEKIDERVF